MDACYLYCYSIGILINTGDSEKAYKMAKEEAKIKRGDPKDSIEDWFVEIDAGKMPVCDEDPLCDAKDAFYWSFHFLKNKTPIQKALEIMIKEGGDTDTNAAIVCGLLGGAQGLTSLNKTQIEKILSARTDQKEWKGRRRGEFLVPALYLPQTLNLIFLNAPSNLHFPDAKQEEQCKK